MNEVIDRAGVVMKGTLREVDFQPLASDPEMLRWRNTAQWARLSMVREGLLRSDSRRGVWEITARGRESHDGPR